MAKSKPNGWQVIDDILARDAMVDKHNSMKAFEADVLACLANGELGLEELWVAMGRKRPDLIKVFNERAKGNGIHLFHEALKKIRGGWLSTGYTGQKFVFRSGFAKPTATSQPRSGESSRPVLVTPAPEGQDDSNRMTLVFSDAEMECLRRRAKRCGKNTKQFARDILVRTAQIIDRQDGGLS